MIRFLYSVFLYSKGIKLYHFLLVQSAIFVLGISGTNNNTVIEKHGYEKSKICYDDAGGESVDRLRFFQERTECE